MVWRVKTCINIGMVGEDDCTFEEFIFKCPEGAGCSKSTWDLAFTVKTYKSIEVVASEEGGEEQESFEATPLGNIAGYTQKCALNDE